jgi:predicted AAA+ superfamily ATPase
MTNASAATELLQRLLRRLDELLPPPVPVDWNARAFRWRRRVLAGAQVGWLEAVHELAVIEPGDLLGIDAQKEKLLRNTAQFVRDLPANNVLLTGARGTGKSSLVRACLVRYAAEGLRLIEVDREGLADLPRIADEVRGRPERFIVYCDDLSFEPGDASYKGLKAALDGSISGGGARLLIYATSNRRHLMPEFQRENLEARVDSEGELHPGESSEEKVSLSERFGLWVSFHPFRQDEYLHIVEHWLARLGVDGSGREAARAPALQFALQRGSRSGRVAHQFARDWAGRLAAGTL